MPRQLRLEYEGAVYHVMARGDRREAIYHDDRERLAWVDYLEKVCRRMGCRVYGWVLMGNHYHLLVELLEPIWSVGCNGYKRRIRSGSTGAII